jgi:hypothetical protein
MQCLIFFINSLQIDKWALKNAEFILHELVLSVNSGKMEGEEIVGRNG